MRNHTCEGLMLAPNERFRRGLGMQIERIPGAPGEVSAKRAVRRTGNLPRKVQGISPSAEGRLRKVAGRPGREASASARYKSSPREEAMCTY